MVFGFQKLYLDIIWSKDFVQMAALEQGRNQLIFSVQGGKKIVTCST